MWVFRSQASSFSFHIEESKYHSEFIAMYVGVPSDVGSPNQFFYAFALSLPLRAHIHLHKCCLKRTTQNKLASLEDKLVQNHDLPTYLLTGVWCRSTNVAKNIRKYPRIISAKVSHF